MNQIKQFSYAILLTLLLLSLIPSLVSAQSEDNLRETLATRHQGQVGAIEMVESWAIFTMRQPDGSTVGLAHWNGNTWETALSNTAEFSAWLPQLPQTLLSAEGMAYLQTADTETASGLPHLQLPFPHYQTWRYLAGPNASPYRRAVDFGPLGIYDYQNPYAPFTGRERDVTAAADGVVIDKDTYLLVLRHEHGWETAYYGLAQSSNVLRLGDVVHAGDILGLASKEVAPEKDVRVSFWVRRNGIDQPSNNLTLSGWEIFQDNSYETGDGKGTMIYQQRINKVDCATVATHRFDLDACHITHFAEPLLQLTPQIIAMPQGSTNRSFIEVVGINDLREIEFELTHSTDDLLFPFITVSRVASGTVFHESIQGRSQVDRPNRELFKPILSYRATLTPTFSGSGSLLEVEWRGQTHGETVLNFSKVMLRNSLGEEIPVTLRDGIIRVLPSYLVEGRITFHSAAAYETAHLSLNGEPTSMAEDGTFSLETEGDYQLTISAPQHLSVQLSGGPDTQHNWGDISMVSGDVNGDEAIDLLDLAYLGSHYQHTVEIAALKADGTVNVFDLTMAAVHYGSHGPVVMSQ